MSITTYSELKTALANWLHRSDLTSRIPEFISLAEAEFKRRLRLRDMEIRATASTDGDGYLALPSDYLEMRNLRLNTDPKTDLEYVTPQYMDSVWGGSLQGKALVYTIVGDELRLAPKQSGNTVEMLYYGFSVLSDSNTTNFLLTNHPDVYLFGGLVHAGPYLGNDPRMSTWVQMFQSIMDSIVDEDGRAKHAGSVLQQRPDVNA